MKSSAFEAEWLVLWSLDHGVAGLSSAGGEILSESPKLNGSG